MDGDANELTLNALVIVGELVTKKPPGGMAGMASE
jgi:hypothetical protein